MNPNAPQPSFELPSLPGESGPSAPASKENGPAAAPETYLQPSAAPVQASSSNPAQFMPPSAAPMVPPLNPAAPISAPSPMQADDAELIEKEWVTKAKQIVAATKEDPYTQTKEMHKFKADYLRKRYNKDIKVEES